MNYRNQNVIQVYTDGSWNGSRGGYGYVITLGQRMKKFKSDCYYVDSTNNRMELRPVIEALKRIEKGWKIDIYSDSTYVVYGIACYIDNGDKRRLKANPDLWSELYDIIDLHMNKGSKIRVQWVRGHAGNGLNEMADALATEAAINQWTPKVCGKRAVKHLEDR